MVDAKLLLEGAFSMPAEVMLPVLALVSSIVFYAIDFRIGLIASFISLVLAYVVMLSANWDTTMAQTLLLIVAILMTLSLYLTEQRSNNPYIPR
jgi:hypothetical protein